MSIRFSRAQYWLLDIAVEESHSLADLLDKNFDQSINRSSHGCTPDEVADALETLFRDRYITSFRSPFPPTGQRRTYRCLLRPQIEVELHRPKLPPDPRDPFAITTRHPDETFYRLTPAGGAAWEAFARPNWNLFIDGVGTYTTFSSHDPPYPARGYAISPTLSKIQRYVALARHIGHHIDEASIRYDTLSPWKATYWKILPTAHRVRYKMIYHDISSQNRACRPFAYEISALKNWYPWRS